MQLGVARAFCVLLVMSVFGAGQTACQTGGGETVDPLAVNSDATVVAGDAEADAEEAAVETTQGVAAPQGEAFTAYTSPGDLPHLELVDGAEHLPLKHTDVKAWVRGFVAEVEVTQTYRNTHEEPIEAVYIFPLPENSAVNHMQMVIGKREIVAEIKKRDEARQIYEEARSRGNTAALLEQERPNIFTQSVANIAPGEDIDVVVRYVQDLTYDMGQYEFVFPMVVGPRFHQGVPLDQPQTGFGTHADTTLVPDASRISPPVAGPGTRTGHDISLSVEVDAGLPILTHSTPTHDVAVTKKAKHTLRAELSSKDDLPNRDFVLRYAVAGKKTSSVMMTHKGKGKGHFSLIVQPPELDVDKLVGKRELIFVVDVSGSMSGVPLAMCQTAMRESLRRLRPVDTFNVISFSGATATAFDRARPANDHNIREGMAFIDRMRAGGGTYMADAVERALSFEVGKGRNRYVFFLTDGHVSIENKIFDLASDLVERLEDRGQKASVFGFGVGSSPNRHLIKGLSDAGGGISIFASNREDPVRGVNSFFHRIDHAVIRDLEIDWGSGKISAVHPGELPDLFASRPLVVHGRYGKLPDKVVVRGKAGRKKIEIPVTVRKPGKDQPSRALPVLWARSAIQDLRRKLWDGSDKGAVERITTLALDYSIVTAYTSFVAVDTSRVVGDGNPGTILQPVETSEDTDPVASGATLYNGHAGGIPGGVPGGVAGDAAMAAPVMHSRSAEAPSASIEVEALLNPNAPGVRYKRKASKRRARGGSGGTQYKKSVPKAKAKPKAGPKTQMRVGVPEGHVDRNRADIRRVVSDARKGLERCLERSVPSSDHEVRSVVLELTVNAKGRVTAVVVSSGLGSRSGDICLGAAAQKWKFGRVSGGEITLKIPVQLWWAY